jgi:hypothetical protein
MTEGRKKVVDRALLFPKGKLESIKHDLRREAEEYGLSASKWLALKRRELSQFGVETRRPPSDGILNSIGYLVWASSLYEEKASRAAFWLGCFKKNDIVELPGQGTKLSSRLGNLNQFLHDKEVADVLGGHGVRLIRSATKRAERSLRFRDDVVHGHHLGGWSKATVFRMPGKRFEKGQAKFIKLSSATTKRHGNIILGAAAVVALVDHYFDDAYSG